MRGKDNEQKWNEFLQQKNPLKRWISEKYQPEIAGAPSIEIAVTHQIEEGIEVTQSTEVNQETQIEVQVAEIAQGQIAEYDGICVNYQNFCEEPYKNLVEQSLKKMNGTSAQLYQELHTELFANLPNAIKYLTPAAAKILASHLPQLSTFNANNLPAFFSIKKTALGEFILDYDEFEENIMPNIFTPKYEHEMPEEEEEDILAQDERAVKARDDLRQSLNDDELFDFMDKYYFSAWRDQSFLVKNNYFSSTIQDIKNYDSVKMACLKRFLENTGSSGHNLQDTVAAFEIFWQMLEDRCEKEHINIAKSMAMNFSTPKGGNPCVYIERLREILKSTRSLAEQLPLLKGIELSNYGAYYAVKYEGFKLVSHYMKLNYRPEHHDYLNFNANRAIYRTNLDELLDISQHKSFLRYWEHQYDNIDPKATYDSYKDTFHPITKTQLLLRNSNNLSEPPIPYNELLFYPPYELCFYNRKNQLQPIKGTLTIKKYGELLFRFLGQQIDGMPFIEFIEMSKKEIGSDEPELDYPQGGMPWRMAMQMLTTILFFSHERYTKSAKPFGSLLTEISYVNNHNLLESVLKQLIPLFQADVKFNIEEGMLILALMGNMNSCEFERVCEKRGYTKDEITEKLFKTLLENKSATYDFLRLVKGRRFPIIYALDTSRYLSQDTHIANVYYDELLAFSYYLFDTPDTTYYEKNPDKVPLEKLEHVKQLVSEAAQRPIPNPLDSALRMIIDAREPYSYDQFIESFRKIAKLNDEVQGDEIRIILTEHGFKLKANTLNFNVEKKHLKDIRKDVVALIEELSKQFLPEEFDDLLESLFAQNLENLRSAYAEQQISFQIRREETGASISRLALEIKALTRGDKIPLEAFTRPIHVKQFMQYCSTDMLSRLLNEAWNHAEKNNRIQMSHQKRYRRILASLKDLIINDAFARSSSLFMQDMAEHVRKLQSFQQCHNKQQLDVIQNDAQQIARLCQNISTFETFYKYEEKYRQCFKRFNFAQMNYQTLYQLLDVIQEMPNQDNTEILKALAERKESLHADLIGIIRILHRVKCSTPHIVFCLRTESRNVSIEAQFAFAKKIATLFQKDSKDPILECLLKQKPALNFAQVNCVLDLCANMLTHRESVGILLRELSQSTPPRLSEFFAKFNSTSEKQAQIFQIIAKANGYPRIDKQMPRDTLALLDQLDALEPEEVDQLYSSLHQTTPMRAEGLAHALQNYQKQLLLRENTFLPTSPFSDFLKQLEKAPFGERNFQRQFDCSEVERVINDSYDMLNGTGYPYQYRKELMEAFLFVNSCGHELPVFHGKAAKDLSNQELQHLFLGIKNGEEFKNLSAFQKKLMALSLIREAMYRSTGQFPFSTQMISLIDVILHSGSVISNIDTGQGKSLTDMMKSVLCWVDQGRIDYCTSSLVDARRDIANYSPFFDLLGVPYGKLPITAGSDQSQYQMEGINFSTFADLSLFYNMADFKGQSIPKTTVGLVINESDYLILDDNVIYRNAIRDENSPTISQQWIYYAINEFVVTPIFKAQDTTRSQDIENLKRYIREYAVEHGHSSRILKKFDEKKLNKWLDHAITANYILEQNTDYVIPEHPEMITINGESVSTKVPKILMKDGKRNHVSKFLAQQFLCAKLNAEFRKRYAQERDEFAIEPESKTVMASNNKNLLQSGRYQIILGSSATAGSDPELIEQYHKYGFAFSKIATHQKKRVLIHGEEIYPNESKLLATLCQRLKSRQSWQYDKAPSLIFCKNIEVAQRLYQRMLDEGLVTDKLQLFTGASTDLEEDVIQKAAVPGMITITTSMGRNTDIPYDKIVGMDVWCTSIESTRKYLQQIGRTGRQGSEGHIHMMLSQEEFPAEKDLNEFRKELDEEGSKIRQKNEFLFDFLGHLRFQLEATYLRDKTAGEKAAFFTNQWGPFSEESESLYHTMLQDSQDMNPETWLTAVWPNVEALCTDMSFQALQDLREMMQSLMQQTIKDPYVPYKPYQKDVTLKDCVVPINIAYQLLPNSPDLEENQVDIKAIKDQLADLFKDLNHHNLAQRNVTIS